MVEGIFVERGVDHLSLNAPLHIRHLFRALVDEQQKELDFGVIFLDGLGDLL